MIKTRVQQVAHPTLAKFIFVGTNEKGNITTIHTKSGKDFWKTLNNNPNEKVIYPKD